jgi:hypothetical protein
MNRLGESKMTTRFAAAAIVAITLVCQASPSLANITYDFITYPDAYQGCTLSGTITTDGHLGDIGSGDVVSWNWTITGPDMPTLTRDQTTSYIYPLNSNLTATTQDLTITPDGCVEFDDTATTNAILLWNRSDRDSLDHRQRSGCGSGALHVRTARHRCRRLAGLRSAASSDIGHRKQSTNEGNRAILFGWPFFFRQRWTGSKRPTSMASHCQWHAASAGALVQRLLRPLRWGSRGSTGPAAV